jgi:predicted DNA-binding transcriptional regulator YafY
MRTDFRNFRVDRIQHAETLAEKFTPKPGQTLADFLKRVRAQFKESDGQSRPVQ